MSSFSSRLVCVTNLCKCFFHFKIVKLYQLLVVFKVYIASNSKISCCLSFLKVERVEHVAMSTLAHIMLIVVLEE